MPICGSTKASLIIQNRCLLRTGPAAKQAGQLYVHGTRRAIANDEPIIGVYGVNKEGSGDMYYKGGNLLNMVRTIINDDEKWRGILRGLNKTFLPPNGNLPNRW
jgi:hypothetical protein